MNGKKRISPEQCGNTARGITGNSKQNVRSPHPIVNAGPLKLPDQTVSEEERQRALNADLAGLSPAELFHEIWRASRVAARDPKAFVWVGPHEWLSAKEWANQRVSLAFKLLTGETRTPEPPVNRKPRRMVTPWLR